MSSLYSRSVTLGLLTFYSHTAFGQEALVDEVRREVRNTISEMKRDIRLPLRVHTVTTGTSSNAKIPPPFFDYTLHAREDSILMIRSVGEKPPTGTKPVGTPTKATAIGSSTTQKGTVLLSGMDYQPPTLQARNARYAFRLIRAAESDTWLLAALGKAGQPDMSDLENGLVQERDQALQSVDQMSVLDGVLNMTELFEAEGFRLIAATRSEPAGPVVIQSTRAFRGLPGVIVDCKYTFDPASRWLPVEWVESAVDPKVMRSRRRTVQKVISGSQRYTREFTQEDTLSKPEPATLVRKGTSTVETDRTLTESDFRLPAYGLPEPAEFRPKWPPFYVWLLLIAAGCLCLAVGFRWLSRRQAR